MPSNCKNHKTSTNEEEEDDDDDWSNLSESFGKNFDHWKYIRRRQDSCNSDEDAKHKCALYVDVSKTSIEANTIPLHKSGISRGKHNWLKAIEKAKTLKDPWSSFDLNLPVEEVVRHRYNAVKKVWVKDNQHVKIEPEQFNAGAMRNCYRLKKDSSFAHSTSWSTASNYVAKCYKNDVPRDTYFQDVRLQMDAKLWAEEFNRHNPPKKVDIFQMCIIEFVNRPDKPLYHLEHFIEGDYVKHNSNSGFVDETSRNTPHALSHFTFECSGHALIVVDIQGVDDLYTDPQIHTAMGDDYGDGNLGFRGMALFFHTHICNSICKTLGLSEFDLAPSELAAREHQKMKYGQQATQVRATQESTERTYKLLERTVPVYSPGGDSGFEAIAEDAEDLSDEEEKNGYLNSNQGGGGNNRSKPFDFTRKSIRLSSFCDFDSVSKDDEEEADCQVPSLSSGRRSSCVVANINACPLRHRSHHNSEDGSSDEPPRRRNDSSGTDSLGSARGNSLSRKALQNPISILGMIHFEMTRCHEIGRYYSGSSVENMPPVDWDAAIFHAEQATRLGIVEGALNLARLWLGLERNMFVEYHVVENIDKGLEFMDQAAKLGDRSAMLHMAQVLETGISDGLANSSLASKNWGASVQYYRRVIEREGESDAAGGYDALGDVPMYKLQAKIAEMLLHGGPGLESNPEEAAEYYEAAAELAISNGQGKLADRYYTLSSEAYAMVEE